MPSSPTTFFMAFLEDCYPFAPDSHFQPSPFSFTTADVKKRHRTAIEIDADSQFDELMTKLLSFDDGIIHSNPENPNSGNWENSNPPNHKRPRSDDASSDDSTATGRRLWVKNRSNEWWEQVSNPNFPEEEFKKAFRMSRGTFEMICNELEPVITKKDTMLRSAIPVRQRVAVCVWRLATGEALREVSRRFGLGISTCHKLVLEVCKAISTVLMPKFLQWPNPERAAPIKSEFQMTSGIPNVIGAMHTTQIPIIAPKSNPATYLNKWHTERNKKTSYTVAVQGVFDARGAFTDVSIGWPGSMTNDQVLNKSSLHQRASLGLLKHSWIVGTSGHPLTDWILVPYSSTRLTWTQHAFNEKAEEIQRVAKESFLRLKARWGCLQKRSEMKLQDLPVVLVACCVLHNVCEAKGDGLNTYSKHEDDDDEVVSEDYVRSVNAMHVRDQIAYKLLHQDFGGTTI